MAEKDLEWTDEEIKASVVAYLEMLNHQEAERPYSKAEYRRELISGPLSGRSESSVEYRMQYISAAMEELCLPVLRGYLPAKNVGARVKDSIKHRIEELGAVSKDDYVPVSDHESLDVKTRLLMQRHSSGKRRGQLTAESIVASSQSFKRDPLVRAWVLQQVEGICECCQSPSPFRLPDGLPY